MKLWIPAYGKRMRDARAAGKHPRGIVLISMGLWIGRPWPQDHLVVVPDDAPAGRLDLRMLAGCRCYVVLATEGAPGEPLSAAQQAAQTQSRLRAAQVADLAWHVGADVYLMVDVRSRWSAQSNPGRPPVWWPVPEYEFLSWRASGLRWEPALRRSAA